MLLFIFRFFMCLLGIQALTFTKKDAPYAVVPWERKGKVEWTVFSAFGPVCTSPNRQLARWRCDEYCAAHAYYRRVDAEAAAEIKLAA
jgi:hypothetical protein